MEKMAYSFHVGSDKNKKNSVKKSASKNISGTTSLSNNAIQNASQLTRVEKHNYRKYDNNQDNIVIVKGTAYLSQDVKDLYLEEFEESRLAYNEKQTRKARMIDNYFNNISNNDKNDLAVEIIVELGDKNYWDTKDINFKRKMTNVYKEQIKDLEDLVPDFKIANAIIHYDETSPHMHIVGVPVKYKNKNGLEKQVGKCEVFTRDSLRVIQDKMRAMCIETFNREYDLFNTLKTKLKGRNIDIHVSAMDNYEKMKDELYFNKDNLDKADKKSDELNIKTKYISSTIDNLKQSKINKDNYILTTDDKNNLTNYLNIVDKTNNDFKEMNKLSVLLENVSEELESDRDEIKILIENNDALKLRNQTLAKNIETKDKKIKELQKENKTISDELNFWKNKFMSIINFIKDKLFGNKKERDTYIDVASDLNSKKIILDETYDDMYDAYKWIDEKDSEKIDDDLEI